MTEQNTESHSRSSLGRPVKSYPGRTVSWNDFFLWAIPGVMIPLAVLALGTYASLAGITPAGVRPTGWYALAGLSIIPYALLSFRRFASARKAVFLYENGIRLRNISKRHSLLLWCQIGSIRSTGTYYHFFGLPVSDSLSLILEPVHGPDLVIPESIRNIDELAEAVKRRVYPLLYASMTEDLRQGHPLQFGVVSVENSHLSVRGKQYPWDEVGSIWVESGNLMIENGARGRIRVPTHQINNLELLLRIIETHFSTP